MRVPRFYIDTSVIGGVFDQQFAGPSSRLFAALREGKWRALVSDVTVGELIHAPDRVRAFFGALPVDLIESVEADSECAVIASEYLQAGALPASMGNDALHVALASVHHADLILSWNFKHLVNWARIRSFNAVNLRLGYAQIEIRSPLEVTFDE